jgi:hypothetical protein
MFDTAPITDTIRRLIGTGTTERDLPPRSRRYQKMRKLF